MQTTPASPSRRARFRVSAACAGLALGAAVAAGPLQAASAYGDPFGTAALTAPNPASAWDRPGAALPCTEPHPATAPWTLTDVVNQALCYNPQTREVWANARAQAAQLGVSRSAYLPSLTLSGTASRSRSNVSGVQTPVQNRFDPSLSAQYLLFDFGARKAGVDSAREALRAADWTHNATLQSVMLAAIDAYYRLLASQAAVTAARESETASREAYDAAAYRHQVGAAAIADELQARTAWSQARLKRQQADGAARIAVGTLANVLGLAADTPLRVAGPSGGEPTAGTAADVHRLITAAEAARPDLRAAEAQVRGAQADIRAARAGGRPTLSLVAGRGYTWNQDFPNSNNWNVGVALNVPLFTGYSTTYQVHAAEARLESRQAAQARLRQQVALDVWTAYQNLGTALDSYRSSADLLASAEQSAQVALGRYKAGAGTVVELLSAQSALASARLQRIQARYDWFMGRAALAQAIGRLEPGAPDELP